MMNHQIALKIVVEIESCERLIGSEFNPREGDLNNTAAITELKSKVKSLENYLPRIKDSLLHQRCKSVIATAKQYIK